MKDLNFKDYWLLLRGDKPIGFLLLWWPVMWALWIAAEGSPQISNVIIFTLGCFFMRSAGCVVNDIADRNIDKYVQRTKMRPLTAGRVTLNEALGLFIILCVCALLLVLMTNQKTLLLSGIALLLAIIYPFSKRWFAIPQLFLGAAFSWGIVMAFAAENRALDAYVLLLYAAVLAWVVSYDTFYALVDRDDDIPLGIKSSAIFFGRYARPVTAVLQLCFLLILLFLSIHYQFASYIFVGALLLVAALFIYQQILVKSCDKEKYFRAFTNNNWVGIIIFGGIYLHYL